MSFLHAERFRSVAHNGLRIVAGLLFWQHGAQKLLGWFGGFGGTPGGTAELFSLMGLAGALEFFGGILILAGLFTRGTAFVLSGQMAVAYFMAHFPRGFWPIENQGETAALYAFLFLLLAALGPGSFSLDAALGRETADAAGADDVAGTGPGAG